VERVESDREATRIGALADRAFLRVELFAYLVLGFLLALSAFLRRASWATGARSAIRKALI
jgi:hypothetical protein